LDDIPVFHHGKIITSNKDSKKGIYTVKGSLPENILNAGIYKFKLIFGENQRLALFTKEELIQFEVLNEAIGTNSMVLPGLIRPQIEYNVSFI
jgi:lipopolysaccharide transport system ATP-binding protein